MNGLRNKRGRFEGETKRWLALCFINGNVADTLLSRTSSFAAN